MDPTPSGNPIAELRNSLFSGEPLTESLPDSAAELRQLLGNTHGSHQRFCIWKRLRDLGICPCEADASEVLGVAGEVGTAVGSALVFGLRDGSASMYTSTGGGVIGGGGHKSVRLACTRLMEAAQPFINTLPIVDEFPYPEPGCIRMAVLTPQGVHAVDVEERRMSSGEHELSPLFAAWNDLVAQLRLTDPKERRAAQRNAGPAYVNCLLTMMWEKSLSPVTITTGESPPDLRQMATTPDDHKFLDEIEVPPAEVDSAAISATLLKLAGFGTYSFFKKSGKLRAKLARPDGLIDVCFLVERTRDDQQRKCLVVSRSE